MSDVGLEARVLVCDPKQIIFPKLVELMYNRFGVGEPPNPDLLYRARAWGKFEMGNVEFIFFDDIKGVKEEVRTRTKRNESPYYSLVVYETTQIDQDGIANVIAGIRNHDFLLPQMIVGKGLKSAAIGHCARAGALYFAETAKEVENELKKIFRKPNKLPNLTVAKIGGSTFDFTRQNPESLNLKYVCDALSEIHQERENTKKDRKVNRILVNVGAGQFGDILKDLSRTFGYILPKFEEMYPQQMADALKLNISILKNFFDQKAKIITTGAFYYIGDHSASKRILLIGTAPHYVMARDSIPLQDSDTHTIALAEFYGAERIVLIKRTDGIYDFDPYRGFVLDQLTHRCADIERWKEVQRGNKRHTIVTIEDLLNGNFSREGTGIDGKRDGSAGHLMEDSALRYMLERCRYVKEIVVAHISPEELHYPIGEERYRHIITGETVTIDPRVGWNGILKQNIRNAFNGIAYSKIVTTNY